MTNTIMSWIKAAGIRAIKTAAQAAISILGASVLISEVDWLIVASASAFAAALSLLTSVAGIPEVDGGVSVAKLAKHEKEV